MSEFVADLFEAYGHYVVMLLIVSLLLFWLYASEDPRSGGR